VNPDGVYGMTVAQVRADPMIARALDRLLAEAETLGWRDRVIDRSDELQVSELLAWTRAGFADAVRCVPLGWALAAAAYRLLALLGVDVLTLDGWYRDAVRGAVLRTVVVQVAATCKHRLTRICAPTGRVLTDIEELGHCDFCGGRGRRVARSNRPSTLGPSRICFLCADDALLALSGADGPGVTGNVESAAPADSGERLLKAALASVITVEKETGWFDVWIQRKTGVRFWVGVFPTRKAAEAEACAVTEDLAHLLFEAVVAVDGEKGSGVNAADGPGVPRDVVTAEMAERGKRRLKAALARVIRIEPDAETGEFGVWIHRKGGPRPWITETSSRMVAEAQARWLAEDLALVLWEALDDVDRQERGPALQEGLGEGRPSGEGGAA
jgi:hypothetical protein